MITIALAVVAFCALVLLARQEGELAEEVDELGGGRSDAAAGSDHARVRHEVIRFAGAAISFAAGGLSATFIAARSGWGAAPGFLALLLIPLLSFILLRVGMARSRGLAAELPAQPRIASPPHGAAVTLVRAASVVGERIAAMTRLGSHVSDNEEASEQFSKVLSSEVELSKDEEKLLRGAISLPRSMVRDVMVPRNAVVGIEAGTRWSEVVARVTSSEHSRLPAFRDNLDDVLGVLVAKDLLPYALRGEPPEQGWEKLVRAVAFVPVTRPVADQLREFRHARTHMAVVVDEYGGTAGILTIEDVLEELVGEIRDEHDVEEPLVTSEEGVRFWVAGRLPIDELEEVLGESLESGAATTVGGAVFERTGRIPRVGEELVWGRYRVVVERMRRHAVDRVYLERLESEKGGGR